MFARTCAAFLFAASAFAADTVTVYATSPQADEQGLVPGKVTFIRTGTTSPLRVTWRIQGSAQSTVHNGHVSTVQVTDVGGGYRSNQFTATASGGFASGAAYTSNAVVQVNSPGGAVSAITITNPGSGYGASAVPTVTISNGGGSGAQATAVLSGYLSSLSFTSGSGLVDGLYGLSITGGGGINAQATATVSGGIVTGVVIDDGGSGYTAAPTVAWTSGGTTQPTFTASIDYQVGRIDVSNGGSGYTGTPTVTIDLPPSSGTRATAVVSGVSGSPIYSTAQSGLLLTHPGYGYAVPVVTDSDANTARLRPVVVDGVVSRIAVEEPGSGYAVPTISITGGTGSGATARAVLKGGVITEVIMLTSGSGYTAPVTVTTSPAGGASLSAVVSGGQIVGISVANGGVFSTPTLTLSETGYTLVQPTTSVTVEAVDATAASGRITAVEVLSGGSGFATPSLDIDDGFSSSASASLTMSGPDYSLEDSSGNAIIGTIDANGDLTGIVDLPTGISTYDVWVIPHRNGVGGGRTVQMQVRPSPSSSYIVGAHSAATVTIADADIEATISATRPTAYPTVPTLSGALPLELQGRAEWYVQIVGDVMVRDVSVQIDGDTDVAETATEDDCDLIVSDRDIEAVNVTGTVVKIDTTNASEAPPGPGDSTIGTAEYASFTIGDAIIFENPSGLLNGYYRVTAINAPTAVTMNGSVTIDPPIRTVQTSFGTSRIRKFGYFIDEGLGVPAIPSRFSMVGWIDQLYFFALPKKRGTANPAGTARSVNINLIQSADFRTLSPTSATAVVAADDTAVGLRLMSNAGQPATNGVVRVVSDYPFADDVDVPFIVSAQSGVQFDTHYTIDGVDASSRIGAVRLPAGESYVDIDIKPLSTALTAAGSITIALLQSEDYLLKPIGTSPVNPTVQVTIAPGLQIGGNQVYLSVQRLQDGGEGTQPAIFRVLCTDVDGNALTGSLSQNLGFTYALSGSAEAVSDYTRPNAGDSATILAGANHVDITFAVVNDTIAEIDETLTVTLNAGLGFQIAGANGAATATISDDEPLLSIVAGVNAVEGGTHGSFVLHNEYPVSRSIPVTLSVSSESTATINVDYTVSLSVVILPNVSDTTIDVLAIEDSLSDVNETITLVIEPSAGNAFSIDPNGSQATISIVDSKPSLAITATVATAVEGGSSGRFTITNTNTTLPSTPTVIAYTVSGTATSGTDYTALSGTVTLPASTAAVNIPVAALADSLIDTDETVVVTLTSDAAYVITAGSASATVVITDSTESSPEPSKPGLGGGSGGCGAGASAILIAGALGLFGLRRRRRI